MGCNSTNRLALPGSPSSCAIDESIVPLPSIFFLIFAVIYIAYTYTVVILRRKQSISTGTATNSRPSFSYTSPGLPVGTRARPGPDASHHILYGPPVIYDGTYGTAFWTRLEKIVHYTYLSLVGCLLGMRIVEIIRLDAAEMGVGLLPFGIVVSLFLVFAIATGDKLGMGRTRNTIFSSALLIYWAFSLIMESVKVARLATYNVLHPAKGTNYSSSDWLLDNAVILALITVFFLVEGAYLTSVVRHTLLASDNAKLPRVTTTDYDREVQQASAAPYNPPEINSTSHPFNYRVNVGHTRNESGSSFSLSSQSHQSHSVSGQSQRGSQLIPGSPRSWTFGGRSSPRIDKSTISKPVALTSNSIGF